jgi:hypothetical protein
MQLVRRPSFRRFDHPRGRHRRIAAAPGHPGAQGGGGGRRASQAEPDRPAGPARCGPGRSAHRGSRVGGQQTPQSGQGRHPIGQKPRHRAQHGGIEVIRRQDVAQPPRGSSLPHRGCPDGCRRASHWGRPARSSPRLARRHEHPVMHRKFGCGRPMTAVEAARLGLAVVMAQHRCPMAGGRAAIRAMPSATCGRRLQIASIKATNSARVMCDRFARSSILARKPGASRSVTG